MKKQLLLAFVFVVSATRLALCAGPHVNGTVLERTAQPINFTSDFDISDLDRFSVQAIYSDGTPASQSLIDGAKATANLTVVSTTGLTGASITLNGVTLTAGTDWTIGATTTTTAVSISSAIVNSASLSGVITSTNAAGIVYASAAVVGANTYSVTSSIPAKLAWNKPEINNGRASNFSTDDTVSSSTAHNFTTGLRVLFSKSAGTAPTGLSSGTTYYVIKVNDTDYKLASSSTNAVAGTAVDITALTGGGSFTIAPLALSAGSAGFNWQGSDDGSNFYTLSVSSVIYSAAGNTLWDFGSPNYKYLRLNFTGPTAGGIALTVKMSGRKY